MKREVKKKSDMIIAGVGILFFLYVIWFCIQTNFRYYVADSVIFALLTLVLYVFYKKWKLNTTTFFFLVLAFALHDMGAFKFYAMSPVPVEWDVITHLVGIFAATLFLYNIVQDLTKRNHHALLLFVVILGGLGIGVLIEFLEFYGFMTVGFGEGFFGRGFGDFDPSIVSSDYIDTIQDLFWNFIGATLAFIVAFFHEKKLSS